MAHSAPSSLTPPDDHAPGNAPLVLPRNRGTALLSVATMLVLAVIVLTTVLANRATPNTAGNWSYAAVLPGPSCDYGAGLWQKPTNAVGQSTLCASNGFLLIQTAHFGTIDQVFFHGISGISTLPANYQVQADVLLESGNFFTSAGFTIQRPMADGSQSFLVQGNGAWTVSQMAASGTQSTALGMGFLATPSKKFHLTLTVTAPHMTLAINNIVVGTVIDPAHGAPLAIGLALSNPTANGTISALFANFAFRSLPASSVVALGQPHA